MGPMPKNAMVTTDHRYDSQVTLSIEAADGSLTPAGWSTRASAGGNDQPFSFTPGQGLIEGWTKGVLQMREGERAHIHGKWWISSCLCNAPYPAALIIRFPLPW